MTARRQPGPSLRILAHRLEPLCPKNTAFSLGCIPWANLTAVRRLAEHYQPAPQPVRDAGDGLPIVGIQLSRRVAEATIDRVRTAGPFGISVVDGDAGPLITLICEGATFLLMDDLSREMWAVELFLNRRRATDGAHALMLTGKAAGSDERTVFGLIELTTRDWLPSAGALGGTPARPRPRYRRRR